MSHNRNYSKYSEKKKNEEVIESANENKNEVVEMTEDNNQNISEEVVEQTVAEQAVEEQLNKEPTIGFIDGCDKLNVRMESNKDSEVVTILDNATEVTIDLDNSTDNFYKIMTSEGVEGYCMKKFITIK